MTPPFIKYIKCLFHNNLTRYLGALVLLTSTLLPIMADEVSNGEDPVEHAIADSYWAEKAQDYPAFVKRKAARSLDQRAANLDGAWSPVIQWPHIAVTAANLPDGRVLTYASNKKNAFPGGRPEFTYATTWDPQTNGFSEMNHNSHDLFCAAPTTLEDGRIIANGGRNTSRFTSTFDYRTNTWQKIDSMDRGRFYPTSVALPSGSVFTGLGSGGGQYPELWTEDQGWKVLTGASLQDPVLSFSQHYERNFWPLFVLDPRGNIFHSGPTPKMHVINTQGLGKITKVGPEMDDWYPKHGATVMYDEGKLLVAGGAVSGTDKSSTNRAMIVDISNEEPQVTAIAPMNYKRKFLSGVMLPTGEVLVIGGNTSGIKFNDSGTILPTEIWNPDTNTWTVIDSISVPRNYHSIAMLMTDGRVLSAGGGLCGNCATNHQDAQVLTPPYLYKEDGSLATRPVISNAPNVIKNGQTFTLESDTNITKFSLIKMSATTHAVNTDLRYLKLPFTHDSNGHYELSSHSNINVMTPGYWMLFAVNSEGVPSVAKVMQVSSQGTPQITQPENQINNVGESISLAIIANDPLGGTLQFEATGLPMGLSINPNTGIITGSVNTTGLYQPTITVSNSDSSVDVFFNWTVFTLGTSPGVSYEYFEGSWRILPNFNFLTPVSTGTFSNFKISPRALNERFAFRLSARIDITDAGNYTFYTRSDDGSRLWIDGNLVVDNDGLHSMKERSGNISLNTGQHTIVVGFFELTGVEGLTVQYSSASISKRSIPDSVLLQNPQQNVAPEIINPGNQLSSIDSHIEFNIFAADVNNDALSYSATGLPAGLSINNSSGKISGIVNTAGNYRISITVDDGNGGSESVLFDWDIVAPLVISAIQSSPKEVGQSIEYIAIAGGGNSLRYKWNFGDGTESSYSPSSSISHSFNAAGLYVITLFVQDGSDAPVELQFRQAIYAPVTASQATNSSSIVFEKNDDNDRIWNANPDNNTVTVYDTEVHALLAEIPVGIAPHIVAFAPDGRLWVTNKDSATISIINTTTLAVVQTINLKAGSQPVGLAFSPTNNFAYLVLEATGQLLRLDPGSGEVISTLDVGARPRHVSVNANGNKIYVSRFITPPLPDEDTGNPKTTVNGQNFGGEVLVINSNSFTLSNTIVLKHSERPDAENSSRGIPNYIGAMVISPDGGSAWVPSKQDNIKRGVLRDGKELTHETTVRSINSKIDLNSELESTDVRIDFNDGGTAKAAVYSKHGNYLFVALESSREVAVIDAYGNDEIARFDVGRAPQGLALSSDGLTLYTHNFMDRSISVHDVSSIVNSGGNDSPVLVSIYDTVANEQLSISVFNGKQLFYDARDERLARHRYMACASCHDDGDTDGRVWDFTGFGEGLRNTIGLAGHGGTSQGPLHWTASFDEIQDFEGQIRTLGGTGLMSDDNFHSGTHSQPWGDAKEGISQDLDDLSAFVHSLDQVPVSPYRGQNGLTTAALEGQQLFLEKGCNNCHSGQNFTGSVAGNLQDIGTIRPSSGSRLNEALPGFDIPTLRGLWVTGPYLHNGSAKTLEEAVAAHTNRATTSATTTSERLLLANYLRQLDGNVSVFSGISNEVTAGSIVVDGLDSDWTGLTAFSHDPDDISGNNSPINIRTITFAHDTQKLYLRYDNYVNIDPVNDNGSYISWGWQAYLDTDNNTSTGYKVGAIGADYIIEGNQLMRYQGNGSSWEWDSIGEGLSRYRSNVAEISIQRSLFANPDSLRFVLIGVNESYGGSETELYPDTIINNQAEEQFFEYSFSSTVTPPQSTPVAHAQTVSLHQDNSKEITLQGSDPENDPLTFSVQSNPSHGSLNVDMPNVTYTPDPGFSGSDSFQFIVNDGTENSTAATVSILVAADQTGIISNPVIDINIDGNANDWDGLVSFENDPEDMTESGDIIDWRNVTVAHNSAEMYFLYRNYGEIDSGSSSYIPWGWQAYIDIDSDASTGYQISSIGADYILEGNQLHRYIGTGTNWSLDNPVTLETWRKNNLIEIAIPLTEVGDPDSIRLVFIGDNEAYEGRNSDVYPDNTASQEYLEYALSNTPQTQNRPIAVSQTISLEQNTSLNLNLGTNLNGNGYSIITPASHGTISGDGSTYTPNPDYIGDDMIRFIASNDTHDSSVGTININVTARDRVEDSDSSDSGGGSLPLALLIPMLLLVAQRRRRLKQVALILS